MPCEPRADTNIISHNVLVQYVENSEIRAIPLADSPLAGRKTRWQTRWNTKRRFCPSTFAAPCRRSQSLSPWWRPTTVRPHSCGNPFGRRGRRSPFRPDRQSTNWISARGNRCIALWWAPAERSIDWSILRFWNSFECEHDESRYPEQSSAVQHVASAPTYGHSKNKNVSSPEIALNQRRTSLEVEKLLPTGHTHESIRATAVCGVLSIYQHFACQSIRHHICQWWQTKNTLVPCMCEV